MDPFSRLPRNPSLSGRLERRRIARRLADRMGTPPEVQEAAGVATPESAANWLRDLGHNLWAGVRLAGLKRVTDAGIAASFAQVVALTALGLLLAFARDFIRVGPAGEFVPWGLPGALFFLPLALCAAWLFTLPAANAKRTLRLLVAVLALTLPIDLLATVAHHFLAESRHALGVGHQAVFGAATAWQALAALMAAIRLGPIPLSRWRLVTALAVAIGVLAWPTAYLERYTLLWMPRDDGNREAQQSRLLAAGSEEVFYRQPRLLEAELAALQPGRKGVVDVYFVGVGGWASEDVFMREVRYAQALFQQRFGAEGRTVTLINNPKTALEAPIASITALEQTLQRVAAVMDRDEDILFLFLTSHGSKEHRFSLEFWPLQLNPLDPARLKSLLAQSGIKWKVVVVSACYSGGFIEPIKDETTLVITASAADRNSFGCSNEADFTYFGKAYLADGLRTTHSFTAAFDLAKDVVTRREAAEEKLPSLPQMHVGAAIGDQLRRLEAELAHGRPPAAEPTGAAGEATQAAAQYEQLVHSLWPSELMDAQRAACVEILALGDPHRIVRRDPESFAGIGPGSAPWSKIVVAYDRYVAENCAVYHNRFLDEQATDAWVQQLAPGDLDRVIEFLGSPVGRRFLDAHVKTNLAVLKAMTAVTIRVSAESQESYAATIQGVMAEQQARRAPVRK